MAKWPASSAKVIERLLRENEELRERLLVLEQTISRQIGREVRVKLEAEEARLIEKLAWITMKRLLIPALLLLTTDLSQHQKELLTALVSLAVLPAQTPF